jgi:hypothetical protein
MPRDFIFESSHFFCLQSMVQEFSDYVLQSFVGSVAIRAP